MLAFEKLMLYTVDTQTERTVLMNYIVNLKEFGFALLKARKLRRMTQGDVSRETGIHKVTIGNIERGKGRPSPKTEKALQELFPEVFGYRG